MGVWVNEFGIALAVNKYGEEGHWVTTEEGQHLFISGDGHLKTSPGGKVLAKKSADQESVSQTSALEDKKAEVKAATDKAMGKKPAASEKPTAGSFPSDDKKRTIPYDENSKEYATTYDTIEAIDKELAPTADHLTPEQSNAVREYTGRSYQNWNNALRGDAEAAALPGVADGIRALQAAIDSAPVLKQPVNVYRGLAVGIDPDKQRQAIKTLMDQFKTALSTGGEVSMNGFSSTSLNPDKASGQFASGDESLVMEISAKKGLYVENHSAFKGKGEYELVLGHNSRFRVVGIKNLEYREGRKKVTVQLEQII